MKWRRAILAWIEDSAVLHLNPGLKLRQINNISPADRQFLNLVPVDYALHAGLFNVDDRGSGTTTRGFSVPNRTIASARVVLPT